METAWIVVLALLTCGYFALAGFDYGVGLLLRVLARDERERRHVLGAVTPFLLGNEVWLVAAVGVLFGAFPRLEGELLSGHHTAFAVLLVGLVAFTAAAQLRSPAWDVVLVGSALVVAVGWGVLLGRVLGGPVVLWAAGVPLLFALHGAVFLAWRLRDGPRRRAVRVAAGLVPPVAGFAVAAVPLAGPVPAPGYGLVAGVAVPLLGGAWLALRSGRHRVAFGCTALVSALPVVAVFGARDVVGVAAMAGPGTLRPLGWAALVVLPLVLLFQWTTWWVRRVPR
ncbi:cytochrome d ubiquinol oxidase subunit II [Saccharothrix syringae]|uniref:Cytochrome d ubiquinol oxidase subunit II n=1 Tax=Saccharothrix syringae TaxID=103733 RepID=A0A5Q0GTR1_SACSY|nr:cytochrome d ubiquinol oxidase subunit II [Saccharothrix syringae]QFZ16762.1 cytochrome d ubiquinol oxidase subunit II [Saccharothrix syringae]